MASDQRMLHGGFHRWWVRERASGLALTDDFEVAVLRTVARAAHASGFRLARRLDKKKVLDRRRRP